MKIGIDISTLQTPHRMRGIGSLLINFINNLSNDIKASHEFVFYLNHFSASNNPLDLLNLEEIKYEIRYKNQRVQNNLEQTNILRKYIPAPIKRMLRKIMSVSIFFDLYFGNSSIKDLGGVDHFLQFDQNQPPPSNNRTKTTLIIYDLIPYILESDYLCSYKTSRKRGLGKKSALLRSYRRYKYIKIAKLVTKKASHLIAISEQTKRDFIKYAGVDPKKISVCLLGVNKITTVNNNKITFRPYQNTSWGYLPIHQIYFINKPFLLFVGGIDPRRKLNELLAAFNNLRARGVDINLVLAGDTMTGPTLIPNIEVQEYLKNTSYMDDIFFLGFITNEQRDYLYQHAVAFVYPSIYEGFGLPVLEAMNYGTPVITYSNSSITEVGGDAVVYVEDYSGIYNAVTMLLNDKLNYLRLKKAGQQRASKLSWSKTVTKMVDCVSNI